MIRIGSILVFAVVLSLAPHALCQTDVSSLLAEGLRGAAMSLKPMPEKERNEILAKIAEVLVTRVTFRNDGVATSVHEMRGSRTHIEWKGLKVSNISRQPVNAADEANGISRKYHVGFSCAACRSWDSKANRWKEWSPTGYILFPSGWTVVERNGTMTVSLNEQGRFLPGPGNAVATGGAHQPVRKGDVELPAGMRKSGSAE